MRFYTTGILLLIALSFSDCRQGGAPKIDRNKQVETTKKEPLRVGMVTGLKPEKVDYYKELHASTWEGVLKKIKECNIRNYSIYLKKIEDKYYLFSYYEYTGDNYEMDMKKIAADSVTQRWWRETDPCQQPLPDAAAAGKIWSPMDEVFHAQ
jgi:L-rhamnose mutarotase